jgi:hypothetical protein
MPGTLEECVTVGDCVVPPGDDSRGDEVCMAWQERTAESAIIGVAYPGTGVDAPT